MKAVSNVCDGSSGATICAVEPTAEPEPVAPTTEPIPAGEPRPAASSPPVEQPGEQRAGAPRVSTSEETTAARPGPRPAPLTEVRTRTVFVPHLIEIVTERPAVAASIAGGLVIAVGVATLFVLAIRRRRRETERSAEEAARNAYGSLTSSFLNHLSHELYTPLTPVRAYASMLKRADLPPTHVHQVADQMLEASGRLERIFEVLVALADVRRGEPDVHEDVVDAADVIGRALERIPDERRGAVAVTIDPALPQFLANDRLLGLAVAALIDNAAKFSEGRITVRADLRTAAEDREFVRIRVTDRGIGMSADQLLVAMDAFRQIDGTLARPYGGLGVGLALADQVARAHGGQIVASSRPGRGSTFTLTIPLIPAARGIAVAAERAG